MILQVGWINRRVQQDRIPVALRADRLMKPTVIFGEDVAFGGVFRCTVGLAEKFGGFVSSTWSVPSAFCF